MFLGVSKVVRRWQFLETQQTITSILKTTLCWSAERAPSEDCGRRRLTSAQVLLDRVMTMHEMLLRYSEEQKLVLSALDLCSSKLHRLSCAVTGLSVACPTPEPQGTKHDIMPVGHAPPKVEELGQVSGHAPQAPVANGVRLEREEERTLEIEWRSRAREVIVARHINTLGNAGEGEGSLANVWKALREKQEECEALTRLLRKLELAWQREDTEQAKEREAERNKAKDEQNICDARSAVLQVCIKWQIFCGVIIDDFILCPALSSHKYDRRKHHHTPPCACTHACAVRRVPTDRTRDMSHERHRSSCKFVRLCYKTHTHA